MADFTWYKYRKRIGELLRKRNIKNFRWWAVIRRTMIVINPFVLLLEAIRLIGNIHQKYHLLYLVRNTNIDFRKLRSIVEIGGGYGAMCVSLYDKGFNGKYVIYDFPELAILQRYYMRKNEINKNILYTFQKKDIKNINKPSLLIALWSLSEMTLKERKYIEEYLLCFDYYLFGFQLEYGDINNMIYFNELLDKIGGTEWKLIKIPHLRGDNYYLISEFIKKG